MCGKGFENSGVQLIYLGCIVIGLDLLICAEDPGAANFLVPLVATLESEGLSSTFFAHPRIAETLCSRGVTFNRLEGERCADDLIASHRPDVLVTGTTEFPDCFGLTLIDAARRSGVPSIAVIDMVANAAGRFRGFGTNPLQHAPDWLAVCDDASGDAFKALGFPASRIVVCGHPHFDWIRERRRDFAGEDRENWRRRLFPGAGKRQVIVFVAESVDRLEPGFSFRSQEYTLHGRGTSDYRTAIVLEELLDAVAEIQPKPYVVLRLHPKNRETEFTAYRGEINLLSAGGDPVRLVWAADAVVGMTSMLLVEAQILGVPTLSILPRDGEKALIVTTANGLTQVVTTRIDLREKFPSFLAETSAGDFDKLPEGALGQLVNFIKERLIETKERAQST